MVKESIESAFTIEHKNLLTGEINGYVRDTTKGIFRVFNNFKYIGTLEETKIYAELERLMQKTELGNIAILPLRIEESMRRDIN